MSGLSNKRRAFVVQYLKDFNATQAAIRAGYSPKTAYSIGQRLLNFVEVAEAIKIGIAEHSMGADEVLLRLAEHARGDMGDFLDISSVSFQIDLNKAKELGLTHLIKKVKQKTTIVSSKNGEDVETDQIEIELYDAQAALVQLGKHHGLFIDRTDITSGGEKIGADDNRSEILRKLDSIAAATGAASVAGQPDAGGTGNPEL
jgi:phage terminase small subunit